MAGTQTALATSELTRQIYWSPSGGLADVLHKTTYFWLALAVAVAGYGIYRRVAMWRLGKPEAAFDKPFDRTLLFLRYVMAQGKVLRKRRMRSERHSSFAAWMHGLIFYGFLALVFATTMVALKEHGIADLYRGWFYAFTSVIAEVGGLALTVGLVMGVFRRSAPNEPGGRRPEGANKDFKHSMGYSVLYGLLALLCLQGFLIEGLRLAVQENPPDAGWSFVGSAFALLFPSSMSPTLAENTYAGMWYFHMLTTMAFIAVVPYTRAMHIVTASLNLFTQRLEPKVLLPKMDFENTESEYFGPQKILDFTWRDLLDFDSCTECRRCTDICPANAVGKALDPRQIILKLRDSMLVEAQLPPDKRNAEENYLYESGRITHEEIWACTNCGGCVNECPVGIDQLRSIMQLRRYQTLTLGEVPPSAGKAIENIKQHNNPWGVSHADRFKWAEGLDVPVLTGDSPEVEYLYYVGCAGSYDSGNQRVARSVVQILKACGVSYAVMGKAESCTGEPVKRLGDEYSFSEIAISNVEKLQALKFRRIVTHCPHCFNTLKNDYRDYGGQFDVVHHSQLLSKLHRDGKLLMPGEVRKEVTFHDPCFLGRHNGEYDAPRDLLEGIAGLRLHEMELSRETSSCCGMGGGNMWYESQGGTTTMAENRLEHVARTGAKTLVTGCSFCMINFKGAFKNLEATKDLEVIDIAEAVLQAMPQASQT
ncbi:MAG: (Fe-S)-binding protein [Silvanigrellales bacterium]|nr:(Fe-S)-binding protein [Silvanigrellales bacterium]